MNRKNRRRISPGVGYIGAGNRTSVFTRKQKVPFEKIKAIYGDEMERLHSEKLMQNKSFKKLTERDKLEIKSRIKTQLRRAQKKNILVVIIVLSIMAIISYWIWN